MNFRVDINLCRVCMKSENGYSMLNDLHLMRKFVCITQLKVSKNDGLPALICDKCILRLKVAYEFREMATATDRHLRNFILKVSREFQETTKTSPGKIPVAETDEDELHLLLEDEQPMHSKSEITLIEKQQIPDSHDIIETVIMPKIEEEGVDSEIHHEGEMNPEDIEIYQEIINPPDHEEIDEMDEEHVQYIDEQCELQLYDENSDMYSEVNEVSIINDTLDEEHITSDEAAEVENKPKRQYKRRIQLSTTDEHRLSLENKSFLCIKCNKDFSTKTNLMRHMATHDGTKPYQCNICGNSFTQNGSLKQHMLIHTGDKPHTCTICGRGFTQSKSLVFHLRRHTGEKPYQCQHCDIKFRQKDGLKRHVLVKHSNKPSEDFPCNVCNRILHSKYSLQVHMKKHFETPPKETLKCEICEKTFGNKSALDSHEQVHNGERQGFKCNQCDKTFTRKTSLLAHARTHGNETDLSCHACKKEFERRDDLKDHLEECHQSIKQMKQYQCGKCLKSFSIKRNLLQHLKNHNPELMNLYSCEECAIAFDTQRALKLHLRSHHKETVTDLNECEHCNIHFIAVTDLNEHIATVHDAIDENCFICLENFKSVKQLELHMIEHECSH